MGKKAAFPAVLYEHDFARLARTEQHARTRLRWLGLAHLQEGKSYQQVAELLKVHVKSVRNWVKDLADGGLDGLQEQPGRGAKRKLTPDQEQALRAILAQEQATRQGVSITGREIQQLVAARLGVQCSLTTIYASLKRIGWPRPRSRPAVRSRMHPPEEPHQNSLPGRRSAHVARVRHSHRRDEESEEAC